MPSLLMAVATDSDAWMFVSSNGGLTAGRGTPDGALFPYETVDKLHEAHHCAGSVTLLSLLDRNGQEVLWQPFANAIPAVGVQRRLCKNTTGCRLLLEEHHTRLELIYRISWSTSAHLGILRSVTLINTGTIPRFVRVLDGLRNILPYGAPLSLQQTSSSLVDAYKRTDFDPHTRLATFSLTAKILDRAEAGEVLRANVVWCAGLQEYEVSLSHAALGAFQRGDPLPREKTLKGQRGHYLVSTQCEIPAHQKKTWTLVGDVGLGHVQLAELRVQLMQRADLPRWIDEEVSRTRDNLRRLVASADGLQVSAHRATTEHHFSNVLFNCMRGGVFIDDGRVPRDDFLEFLRGRNRLVAQRHEWTFARVPERLSNGELQRCARETRDPDLQRLCYEYLPLAFGRRHGDPSRPWNRFEIRVHDNHGDYARHYEGNWRDIFQNWEALSWSYPEYLPHFIAKFVNASTVDGFNPYRINDEGIHWEVVDPNDPWSNIGYWGDHQIIYLLKLLETLERFDPKALGRLLLRDIFSYADVPYRLKSYDAMVENPHDTITFDTEHERAVGARVERIGSDGRLAVDARGAVRHANLVEKLLVPALSKLSNLVVDAGIWMNTQRPEWNDANNALVGNGVSLVTLCYLRRYLVFLKTHVLGKFTVAALSTTVATWLREVVGILGCHQSVLDAPTITDSVRKEILDALGQAFERYRTKVQLKGLGGREDVVSEELQDLCRKSLQYLDHAICSNRREDGLYHSYNLMRWSPEGVAVQHLPEMLEGQVAVLSSGVLSAREAVRVVKALYASALYRSDQKSFLLYPDSGLPAFVERNVVPEDRVRRVQLLEKLLDAGETSLVERDAFGVYRFQADIGNAGDVKAILDRLAKKEAWKKLVERDGDSVLTVFESVFQHARFTGRSGTMYAYEGLGSIYWHMVAKLLLAVQECLQRAALEDDSHEVMAALENAYASIRSGLGFTKTAAEFGGIPTDPYSHTPEHSGPQQPGMTGQVKEEILTRLGEFGVTVGEGRLGFRPSRLVMDEFLDEPVLWEFFDHSGMRRTLEIPAGSLAFSICQTPVLYERSSSAWIRVIRKPATMDTGGVCRVSTDSATSDWSRSSDGEETSSVPGNTLDVETSAAVFSRSGSIVRIEVGIPAGRDSTTII